MFSQNSKLNERFDIVSKVQNTCHWLFIPSLEIILNVFHTVFRYSFILLSKFFGSILRSTNYLTSLFLKWFGFCFLCMSLLYKLVIKQPYWPIVNLFICFFMFIWKFIKYISNINMRKQKITFYNFWIV